MGTDETGGERGQTPLLGVVLYERWFGSKGPIEAIYCCSKSGWNTEEFFREWLKHFAEYVNASKEDSVLVV